MHHLASMKTEIIVLGRAAPEHYAGKQSVTVIAYSHKLGFVRLYPTRLDSPLKQWAVCSIEAERHENDTRRESYKLKGDWEKQNESIDLLGELGREERVALLHGLAKKGIESLRKGTIALIKPNNMAPHIVMKEKPEGKKGKDIQGKRDYDAKLFIEYNCSPECSKPHRHWVIEWGVYEALRKNPEQADSMTRSLHLENPKYEKYFLIGTRGKKDRYVIIGVIRFKRDSGELQGKPVDQRLL
jgi:hypothetical protein